MLIYYLLALVPFALLGYVLWAYRRKAAEKEAARQERLVLLMGETQRDVGQVAAAAGTPPPPEALPARKGPVWVARERFLSQPEAVVYYLLKTALRRDHEIYVHVALAAVVTVGESMPGFEREARLRRLAQHELSFVVCDKSLRVVAALDLDQEATASDRELKAECLKSVGIRLVRVDPTALPPRDAIRDLIYGDAR